MFKKALIIGSGRGLGKSIVTFLPAHLGQDCELASIGRSQFDMSKIAEQDKLISEIESKNFDLIIYVAGGGPHGEFVKKAWNDHEWALQVGLLAPMKLSLAWLKKRDASALGRFVIVGSRIAESSPDPLAASYAASKHGIKGFVSSLQKELEGNRNRVWLFSPGYIDTDMLPASAPVRHNGSKILSSDTAAQALLRWVKKEDGPWHRVLA
jgi:short-subunit dehydrogenase